MDDSQLKQTLSDLADAILVLTRQLNALGVELLAMQAVLEDKVPGFAAEFERAQLAAKVLAAEQNRADLEHAEQLIRNLRNRLT